jgi:hypothetical protein
VTFDVVGDAVNAALEFVNSLKTHQWERKRPQVRLGVHLGQINEIIVIGEPEIQGMAVNLCARLMGLAKPGQILLTRAAFDEARQNVRNHPGVRSDSLPALMWHGYGQYKFKGAEDDPMEVFEVGAAGTAPLVKPPESEKAKPIASPMDEIPPWRPAVGQEIPSKDGWILEKLLGEGAVGKAWLAEKESVGKHVFKFCFLPERRGHLVREAENLRHIRDKLGARNDIVSLHDLQVDQEPFFLETEYVSGGNLGQWAEDEGGLLEVPLTSRLRLFAEIVQAVVAAHSAEIIHKDIKPSNIFVVVEQGVPRPKLADFGISCLESRVSEILETPTYSDKDTDSDLSGTPAYQPPEVLNAGGAAFTRQGDVYALGVLLYKMCLGDLRRPFGPGWEDDVSDELLREDIATSTHVNLKKRLHDAPELEARIRSLNERRRKLCLDRKVEKLRTLLLAYRPHGLLGWTMHLFFYLYVALGSAVLVFSLANGSFGLTAGQLILVSIFYFCPLVVIWNIARFMAKEKKSITDHTATWLRRAGERRR